MRLAIISALLLAAPLGSAAQPRTAAAQDAAVSIVDSVITPARYAASSKDEAPAIVAAYIKLLESAPAFKPLLDTLASKGHGSLDLFRATRAAEYTREMQVRYPRLRTALLDFLDTHMTQAELRAVVADSSSPAGAKLRALNPMFVEVRRSVGADIQREAYNAAADAAIRRTLSL